ncbi:hypothetical protein MNR02_06745 [Shinella sp. H4-D48]|uniref:hypothetical protein n=1 Tax=Shinella sp. H4-D48 TaxID=2925841 RepID=UPI001F53BCAB|nr:hypothetical protein [Shinella sp. H4-D48]UNK39400.1 hypothetical protein MNR02_06745 [Shinella sp. H4-D48]
MSSIKYYVAENGSYLGSWDTNPPSGSIEVPNPPDDARQVWDIAAEEWGAVPAPEPVQTEPVRVACALRVPVVDDVVQVIGGSYRVAAMMLMDTGTFLAILSENLGETAPYLIPNNGVSIEITEWGGDYAMLEIRDHAGGTLITPASFGFSLYSV